MLRTRITVLKAALIIIGIVMIIFSVGDAKAVIQKDFGKIYDKGKDDYIVDELVTGKIEYVDGVVAEMESSQTVYGIPVRKSVTPYYLCEVENDEGMGYFLIVHATDKDSIEKLNKMMYGSDGSYGMEFKTVVIPEEVMDYTLEAFAEIGIADDVAKMNMANYMLEEADYGQMKLLPLFGLLLAVVPTLMFIFSWRKNRAYKSSRTHYVNAGGGDLYNTAPATNGEPMKRYSAAAYEAHTTPGGVPQENLAPQGRRYDPSAYSGGEGYEPGEMDSIDTTNLKL